MTDKCVMDLIAASARDDATKVQQLVDNGANVNQVCAHIVCVSHVHCFSLFVSLVSRIEVCGEELCIVSCS